MSGVPPSGGHAHEPSARKSDPPDAVRVPFARRRAPFDRTADVIDRACAVSPGVSGASGRRPAAVSAYCTPASLSASESRRHHAGRHREDGKGVCHDAAHQPGSDTSTSLQQALPGEELIGVA